MTDPEAAPLARTWHRQGDPMPNLPADAYEALYDVMKHDDPDRMDDDRARFWRLVHRYPERLYAAARWWSECPGETTVADARRTLTSIAEGHETAEAAR